MIEEEQNATVQGLCQSCNLVKQIRNNPNDKYYIGKCLRWHEVSQTDLETSISYLPLSLCSSLFSLSWALLALSASFLSIL